PTVVSQVRVEALLPPQRLPGSSLESQNSQVEVAATAAPHPGAKAAEASALNASEADGSDREHFSPVGMTALAENILRVDAERIDNVLNLVGELIIGKSMLQQALNEFARQFPKDALRGKFSDAMAFQGRVLNDLQRSVMKIRMVPVEQLFRRFPR